MVSQAAGLAAPIDAECRACRPTCVESQLAVAMDSRTRFIADSRCFSGVCLTVMSDGLHSDSTGETLEELRIRKVNPYITALSPHQMEKRMRLYRQALCAPFKEITKKEYLELLNVLPPIRKREDSFFLSEPYYGELAEFCFTRENRFFKGIRSVCTPQARLDKEIDRYMELIRRKAFLHKGKDTPIGDNDTDLWHITPYFFSVDGKAPAFLCNLVYRDDRRQARTDMAHTLKSLRNSHYRYCWGKGPYETLDCLMDRALQEDLTLIPAAAFSSIPPTGNPSLSSAKSKRPEKSSCSVSTTGTTFSIC